jgi:hypothetical protein
MASQWLHIEYAAGNYGNSIVFGNFFQRSNFEVLVNTVNALVKEKGANGIFYVNDLVEEWAQLAGEFLESYIQKQGWTTIQVRVVAGDVSQIPLPLTHTAHLKNPRLGLIYLDGPVPFFKKLAARSLTGLEVTTHYPKILLAQAELGEWKLEPLGEGERYRFPSGRKRRLPTERFLLRNPQPPAVSDILSPVNIVLGRPLAEYVKPMPTWIKAAHDAWHAFLVTLGIRRQ